MLLGFTFKFIQESPHLCIMSIDIYIYTNFIQMFSVFSTLLTIPDIYPFLVRNTMNRILVCIYLICNELSLFYIPWGVYTLLEKWLLRVLLILELGYFFPCYWAKFLMYLCQPMSTSPSRKPGLLYTGWRKGCLTRHRSMLCNISVGNEWQYKH